MSCYFAVGGQSTFHDVASRSLSSRTYIGTYRGKSSCWIHKPVFEEAPQLQLHPCAISPRSLSGRTTSATGRVIVYAPTQDSCAINSALKVLKGIETLTAKIGSDYTAVDDFTSKHRHRIDFRVNFD